MTKQALIQFMIQLLAADIIFLYSAKRKPMFAVRYCAAVAGSLLLTYFFPESGSLIYNPIYQLVLFLVLLAVSVFAMGFAFQISRSSLLAACVSGYATQHIGYHVSLLVSHTSLLSSAADRQHILEWIVFPPVYLAIALTFGRFAARNEHRRTSDDRSHIISTVIVVICIVLSRFARYLNEFNSISVNIYAITCCLLALSVQFVFFQFVNLQHENTTIRLLWQEERRQYEISRSTMELINIKVHDLKHTLSGLRGQLPDEEVDAIRSAVRIYDSNIKTGNEALDVLLNENSLLCSREGILLSFMGNGADLSFMNVVDVYSLFGNAVSNAIEAVRKLENPEQRVIDIVTERRGEMVSVLISNYFSGDLVYEDELPVTSKDTEPGYHGFGMKSMRLIAQKYGGTLSASGTDGIFTLNIYLFPQ